MLHRFLWRASRLELPSIFRLVFGLLALCLSVTSTNLIVVAGGYLALTAHAGLAPFADKTMPHTTRGGDKRKRTARGPRRNRSFFGTEQKRWFRGPRRLPLPGDKQRRWPISILLSKLPVAVPATTLLLLLLLRQAPVHAGARGGAAMEE